MTRYGHTRISRIRKRGDKAGKRILSPVGVALSVGDSYIWGVAKEKST